MSFRDIRNFMEHLRALNCPIQVSFESFREPNFPLLVKILSWLCQKFDQDFSLPSNCTDMDGRIVFIKAAARFMLTQVNINLNTKQLYGADGYALREMLKVTSVLYNALNLDQELKSDVIASEDEDNRFDLTPKANMIKSATQLATEITGHGTHLYDILSKETEFKPKREQAVSRQLDLQDVESSLKAAVESMRLKCEQMDEEIEQVAIREKELDMKIEKKRSELERAERRLQAVHKIKPAYTDEYREVEDELQKLFDAYNCRYRLVEALKLVVSKAEAKHIESIEEQQNAVVQLINKYEAENVFVTLSDSDQNDDKFLSDSEEVPKPQSRLRIKTAVKGDGGGGGDNRRSIFEDFSEDNRSTVSGSRAFGRDPKQNFTGIYGAGDDGDSFENELDLADREYQHVGDGDTDSFTSTTDNELSGTYRKPDGYKITKKFDAF